jgi:hypothetical protein
LWRGTSHYGSHEGILQLEAIMNMFGCWLIRKVGCIQRAHEEIRGTITGEHTSGPVAAMSGRCQTDYHNFGFSVTETRDRRSPILPVHELFLLSAGNISPVLYKSRTAGASDDLFLESLPFCSFKDSYSLQGCF